MFIFYLTNLTADNQNFLDNNVALSTSSTFCKYKNNWLILSNNFSKDFIDLFLNIRLKFLLVALLHNKNVIFLNSKFFKIIEKELDQQLPTIFKLLDISNCRNLINILNIIRNNSITLSTLLLDYKNTKNIK